MPREPKKKILDDYVRQLVDNYAEVKRDALPFTAAETVIMALVDSPNEPKTRGGIFAWISENFRQFRCFAYAILDMRGPQLQRNSDKVIPGFTHAFNRYNMPIYDAAKPTTIALSSPSTRYRVRSSER